MELYNNFPIGNDNHDFEIPEIEEPQDDYQIFLPLTMQNHFVPDIPYPEDIERDVIQIGVDEDGDNVFDPVDIDGDGDSDLVFDRDGINTVSEIHKVLSEIDDLGTDEFLYEIHLQSGVYDLTQNSGEFVETVDVQSKYDPD
ncbi:hypothetical protein GF362_05910 [Candidatus Dojkabacteria bacterium]|nr:hypothetical protein [Candidatus Dojkabacteria bacterium]